MKTSKLKELLQGVGSTLTHNPCWDFVVIVMGNLQFQGSLSSFHLSVVATSANTHSHMLTVGTGALIQQQQVQTSTRHQR